MVAFMFDVQTLQFENGINGHEDRVVLCGDSARGGFGQRRVRFQWFVKHFHFPPFLVDCRDGLAVTRQITAHPIQQARAAVFVCKDLSNQKHCLGIAF